MIWAATTRSFSSLASAAAVACGSPSSAGDSPSLASCFLGLHPRLVILHPVVVLLQAGLMATRRAALLPLHSSSVLLLLTVVVVVVAVVRHLLLLLLLARLSRQAVVWAVVAPRNVSRQWTVLSSLAVPGPAQPVRGSDPAALPCLIPK